ncbi:MAG: ABC transporter ATP-binding protein [Nitrospira sp.]|nr:ABC transporter ATP-binding protein [bacterium]MBL7049609.1 ABC transporter ATP-binding protein [Nitrospira sp.]
MNIITANNITKDYKEVRAVNNVSYAIERGEFYGFLGPNGAGKTTVMSMIYCYMPPTSGTLNIFEMDVTKSASLIKSRMGVMPQDSNLDPDLSVIENLIVYARYFDIPKSISIERARDLLSFVELQEKKDVNIQNLSGGMKRRLLLARALINNPEILILDEPTTGLDPHSRRDVWTRLAELKSQGMTLILTTHYMEEAENLCDRVAIMDSGKIISIDSPSSLMNVHNGNLEHVYMTLTGRGLKG